MNLYDSPFYKDLCAITNQAVRNLLTGPPPELGKEFDEEAIPLVVAGGIGVIGHMAQELAKRYPERCVQDVGLDLGLPGPIAKHLARITAAQKATLYA